VAKGTHVVMEELTGEDAPAPGSSRMLDRITGPGPLRELDEAGLVALAAEIREELVRSVCATGGHLGPNLGVVELTIALHVVFRSPRDAIVFDTGHQSYVHKLLTGRRAGFGTLRRAGGLSGYPSRAESAHDWVENSHASTALSYADGIAKAFELTGGLATRLTDGRHVVAVIGDGALTGGLAWEGLNNLADAGRPVIVVLNDNGRSYAPTTGGIARHLRELRQGTDQSTLFERLGLAYVGPVDGHDVPALVSALRRAAALGRPVVVHALTRKGRGYPPAEADEADHLHGVGLLDPATGRPLEAERPSWSDVFGEEILALGHERPELVCVTAAMLRPVGLAGFAARFPGRVFDVGIAEQHAVCSAAGLAMGGLRPVVCLYATFLGRAFDQVLMDVALHRLGVTFVLDRAGVTGPDGASHHGMWDLSVLSAVPGARVAAPRDPARLRELLREAVAVEGGPTVVRFPKAVAGPDIGALARMNGIDILHRGRGLPLDVLIVCVGAMAAIGLEAGRELGGHGVGATVADPRWVLPADAALVHLAARHRLVITVEDGVRDGGAGAALARACADAGVTTPVRVLGLATDFLPAGGRAEILAEQGLTAENIVGIALTVMKCVMCQ
jgi:1-deoxy-D-xylulose-5-phosphate synthase